MQLTPQAGVGQGCHLGGLRKGLRWDNLHRTTGGLPASPPRTDPERLLLASAKLGSGSCEMRPESFKE